MPTVGDPTSAAERADALDGWAMGEAVTTALAEVVGARRDIRRFRPDPLPPELLEAVLRAGHQAPSVGHSQPWRFVVVDDPDLRARAAHLADRARLAQAEHLASERAGRLLDLKLEGLREAPIGVVLACDRRTPAGGVLGRATFTDADLWSCACAIENMWLTARAHGLGMGWVTLFEPAALADLLGLPDGVETLGWLCLGWPDERPPEPGLERAAWSRRQPLEEVVVRNRWPREDEPSAPVSHLRAPDQAAHVGARDEADELLAAPDSLGVLDRVLSSVLACAGGDVTAGTLVVVASDHPVTGHGVSAYPASTTRDVLEATVAGTSLGATSARSAGLRSLAVDAGVGSEESGWGVDGAIDARVAGGRGDLVTAAAMSPAHVEALLAHGRRIGHDAAEHGLVCLGEVGVGNTTVAAALAALLLGLDAEDVVGLGSGADAAIVQRKKEVVAASLARARAVTSSPTPSPTRPPGAPQPSRTAPAGRSGDAGTEALAALAAVGGPEIAVLTGVVLGAAGRGRPVILDGLAASLPALLATRIEPAVQAHLVAGQVSRERAHPLLLRELGLEPLLSLRLRAGEGVGACLASSMVLQGLAMRRQAARTRPRPTGSAPTQPGAGRERA